MKIVKALVFLVAWILSFGCGVYLFSVIFMGNNLSILDIIVYGCGYIMSMLWLFFNSMK